MADESARLANSRMPVRVIVSIPFCRELGQQFEPVQQELIPVYQRYDEK